MSEKYDHLMVLALCAFMFAAAVFFLVLLPVAFYVDYQQGNRELELRERYAEHCLQEPTP